MNVTICEVVEFSTGGDAVGMDPIEHRGDEIDGFHKS